jgi:hypothetical protein
MLDRDRDPAAAVQGEDGLELLEGVLQEPVICTRVKARSRDFAPQVHRCETAADL